MPNLSQRRLSGFVCFLFILLAFTAAINLFQLEPIQEARAQGNTYYVPGDFATIQAAVNAAQPGDTIMVREGTYSESLHFSRSGQAGRSITLTNYGNEKVTINGVWTDSGTEYWVVEDLSLDSSTTTVYFDAWGRGTHHWTFRGCYIEGAISIHGSYNLIEDCEVDGSYHHGSEDGISFRGHPSLDITHHNTVRNCNIHHFNSRGIWTQLRTHDDLFKDNHVHHIQHQTYSMCIDTDGYGDVEWRHTIRGNLLHDCDQAAIEMENTFDSIVENNIIYNGGKQGIHVINYAECDSGGGYGGSDCRGMMTKNIVRQNLVYNSGTDGGIVSRDAGGVKVWGNTVYGGPGPGIGLINWQGHCPGWEVRGNIIVENRGGAISTGGNSLADEDHNLFSDPRFVNPSQNDFHLQANSPAIDAGIDIGLTTDLDGNPRPQGAGYDIGAYEYGGSQPRLTPTPTPTSKPSFNLNSGWNQIAWPNISGYTAKSSLEDINQDCGSSTGQVLARKNQDFWEEYIQNYGGLNFNLQTNQIYFLRASKNCTWRP